MTPAPRGVALDLDSREFAAIGQEVVDLVGAARGLLDAPGAAQADLADAGLSFLTSLIEPLQRCLDQVSGDASALRVKAEEWTALAAELRESGPQTRALARSARTAWTGAAAEAFDATMGEFAETVDGAAGACDGVTVLLRTSGDLLAGAQHLITEVMSQVVDFMIVAEASAAASGLLTAGASEAAALSAILGKVSEAVERSIDIVDRVAVLLERIADALRGLHGTFGEISRLLARLTKLGIASSAPAPAPGRPRTEAT